MNKRGIGIFAIVLVVLVVGALGFVSYKSSSGNALLAPPSDSVTPACSDSDGGNNPLLKGTVSIFSPTNVSNFTDYCQSSLSVKEYFCDDDSLNSVSFACNTYTNYICRNGACVFNQTYLLGVTKQGDGQGLVLSNPAGINCGNDCSQNYYSRALTTLIAFSLPGSVFGGWSGEGCSGTGNCSLMMDSNKSVIAVFNLINSTQNQTYLSWLRRIGTVSSSNERIQKIYPTFDGGVIAIGTKDNQHAWIVKLDSEGNVQNEKLINQAVGYDIIQKIDGEYTLVAGSLNANSGKPTLLIELDEELSLANEKSFLPPSNFKTWVDSQYYSLVTHKSLIQTTDGGYLINDYANYNCNWCGGSTWLIKLDSQGMMQWSRFYDEGGTGVINKFIKIIQTSDGGYLGVGYSEVTNAPWILKLDAAGSIEWEKHYPPSGTALYFYSVEETDEGYIISGTTFSPAGGSVYGVSLYKLDSQGEPLWEKFYGLVPLSLRGGSATQKPNGEGYLVAGMTGYQDSDPDGIVILDTDANGNVLNYKFYNIGNLPGVVAVELSDFKKIEGDYFISAHEYSSSPGMADTSFIAKFSEDGTVYTCNVEDNINIFVTEQQHQANPLQVITATNLLANPANLEISLTNNNPSLNTLICSA